MTAKSSSDITIQFAHPAYRLAERFAARHTGIAHFQSHDRADLKARIGEADVLVISGFWDNSLLQDAAKLRFIQVCAAGYDAFDQDALKARGIRLANASGVNVNAVSEHAMALVLGFTRKLGEARDNQKKAFWRGMISDIARREDELPGKTMLIYGLGAIGTRLAKLARAFGMRVIGIKRDVAQGNDAVVIVPAGSAVVPPAGVRFRGAHLPADASDPWPHGAANLTP